LPLTPDRDERHAAIDTIGMPGHPVAMMHAGNRATSSTSRSALRRGLAVLAWLLAVAVALHFLSVAQAKYTQLDAASYGMFWMRRHWLWVHLGGGMLAMTLGALQFVAPLRKGWPRLHRWTGRVYLAGVLVGLVGATGLIATSPAPAAIRIAFTAIALAWLCTASTGLVAIRARDPARHRRWMIRAYLVTLAPALFRLALLVPGVMTLASPNIMIPTLLWLSWVAPLLIYETARRDRGAEGSAASF
jgi:hypothetical protein